jgi:hypothetical protein
MIRPDRRLALFLALSFSISACDWGSDSRMITKTTSYCVTVVDKLDNRPLDSAYVSLVIRNAGGVYDYPKGITDDSGKCCLEYDASASQIKLQVIRQEYACFTTWVSKFPSKVELEPVAYLQFHIVNVAPADTDDYFFAEYPSECMSSSGIGFFGAGIDTTIMGIARPGLAEIMWGSWHHGIRTDTTVTARLRSRWTFYFEMQY